MRTTITSRLAVLALALGWVGYVGCTGDSEDSKPVDASDNVLEDAATADTGPRDADTANSDAQHYRPELECDTGGMGPEGCPCDPGIDDFCCSSQIYSCNNSSSTFTELTHSWCNTEEIDEYGVCPNIPCTGPSSCPCNEVTECCTRVVRGRESRLQCEAGLGRWQELEDDETCEGREIVCPWDLPERPE